MLGKHHESYYFYANGKSVEVRVESDCEESSTDSCCICARRKSCSECQNEKLAKNDCYWDVGKKMCFPGKALENSKSFFLKGFVYC